MRTAYRILALVLCVATAGYTFSEGNSWDRVRYNGGTLQTKVDPHDWDNHLTVTSDLITFKLKDGQQVEIPTKSVTGLSYGQEAHRRVGTMVALGILISPLALFGLFHKTKLHFIAIEFTTTEGKGSALLLQGDKSNYRAILTALAGATGAPLSMSAKDRESVPALPNTKIVKEEEKDKDKDQGKESAASQASSPVGEIGTVSVKSTPDAADVSADGNFVGNAPASLKLTPGKHTIKVSLNGYKDWTREITVSAGSEVALNAALEKQ
ncbi:MAG TPA: PEGA domain-containing protein [Candidatus Angelobacter sp.]